MSLDDEGILDMAFSLRCERPPAGRALSLQREGPPALSRKSKMILKEFIFISFLPLEKVGLKITTKT